MNELLYMYLEEVTNKANIIHQSITFTNNYRIFAVEEEGDIARLQIQKKDNLYSDYFGQSIININALVGINGSGKTTILSLLGDMHINRKQGQYFILYKLNDLYIIEGNGTKLIKKLFNNEVPWSILNQEYSLVCRYDEIKEKFSFVTMCSPEMEYVKNITYYYYRDRSMSYIEPMYYDGVLVDFPICFERVNLYYRPEYVYEVFANNKAKQIGILEDEFYIYIKLNVEHGNTRINWSNGKFCKNSFIIDFIGLYYALHVTNNMYNIIYDENWRNDNYEEIKQWMLEKMPKIEADECKKIVSILEELHEDYFISGDFFEETTTLCINCRQYDINIINLFYNLPEKMRPYFKVEYKEMNEGAKKAIDVFASIYSVISRIKEGATAIVLLDEPDKGFHPEMSRNLIYNIVETMSFLTNRKIFFQFIITTHSPFILSDIPDEYVHCLRLLENGKTIIEKTQYAFLTNIPEILKNDFFLKSPFGELGTKYYKSLQEEINQISATSNIEEIKKKIDLVGDSILRKYLLKQLENKVELKLSNKRKIEYYIARIKELEND